ncbi:DUF2442 domain-containing protein [Paraburkholderia sp.]|uniref:DUF2442 domain-containing protein n=1 Tax=Paraburkholderia sp. TaxID=1926495 RepID=UPI003A5228D7
MGLVSKLKVATPEQRRDVRISASGAGPHWDQIDEDISVSGLMRDADWHHIQERLESVGVAVKVHLNDL